MAFVKAKIEFKPAAVGTGIKCGLRKGKQSAAKLSFSVGGAALKSLGWKDGDKIEVLIGEGEHHGLIRLRKNNSAGEAICALRDAAKGAYIALSLGHQESFVDRGETAAWCQWEQVEEGWIEIVLPKWADETSPRRSTAQAPVTKPASPVHRPAQIPAKRDVTSDLMGDPAPGRRAMLDRIGEMKA